MGDSFLRDIFPMMQALRTSNCWSKDKEIPFMYCQFNIFYVFAGVTAQVNNIMTKLLNSTIEGFNRHDHLPRYIIYIPDEDFLLSLNHVTYGVSYLLGLSLNWLSCQIECLIQSRMKDLHTKKPGAVFANTRIIWVKMLGRVTTSMKKAKIYSLHHKFNLALEEIAFKRKQTHMMDITSLEPRHFDHFGRLGYAGKIQLWPEIDLKLKRFDKHEINLYPERCPLPLPPPAYRRPR